jgi:small neutral amino acid transporter SnatA (MarC family)
VVAAVLAVLIAVDPIGFGRLWPGRRTLALYVGLGLVVSVVLAAWVLDVVDLAPEGFWIAAGIVLLVPAFARLGGGGTRDVAGPAAVLVAMSVATRDGTTEALVASAVATVAVLASLLWVREGRAAAIAERIVGALMVVVALDLVRDGVIAV